MWSQLSLDLVETATIVSSLGTLAIAFTSWYQMHRNTQESFLPILSVDDMTWDDHGQLLITITNYGNGPALQVEMEYSDSQGKRHPLQPLIGGRQVTAVHVGTSEQKHIGFAQLSDITRRLNAESDTAESDTAESDTNEENRVLHIHYTSIRHKPYTMEVSLDSFFASSITTGSEGDR